MQCTHTNTHIQTLAVGPLQNFLWITWTNLFQPEDIASQHCRLLSWKLAQFHLQKCHVQVTLLQWKQLGCIRKYAVRTNQGHKFMKHLKIIACLFYYLRKHFLHPSKQTKPKLNTKQTKALKHTKLEVSVYPLGFECGVSRVKSRERKQVFP